MSPRQRKDQRLPDGLRERDGYYSYTSPLDGREYGIGRNRQAAIQQAIEANGALKRRPSLLERISGAANTWGEWCDEFEKLLAARDSKANTRRIRRSQMKRLRACFDKNRAAAQITTRDCAMVIDAIVTDGKHRTAQAFRSFLVDSFDRMIAKGWRKDNPARVLDEVKVKVKRARLSFETFMALYQTTDVIWLRNAMALALVSGQPRECVAAAAFADIRDGMWWNERGKTGARIAIPLALRLECFGMSLDDVVRQCRATGILSKHLVHQTKRAQGTRLGKKLHVDMITRVFTAELAAMGIDWGDKEPPTLHEVRSLSERLYKAQGGINTQDLLGHKDARTTSMYHDSRGDWVVVGLK